jgi:DNA polymerase-3 subunit epsilon
MTNAWIDQGFIAFDTETTGIDVSMERIVTAAAVTFVGGEPLDAQSWLLAVDVEIPEAASAVHGVTTEMSRASGVDQRAGLAAMRSHLVDSGLPIVCFKSDFDIPIFDANLVRCGLEPLPPNLAVCAFVIDKQFNKYVRGKAQRRLQPTAARYGIELSDDDWHGAEADAIAAGRIFLAEVVAYSDIAAMSGAELSRAVEIWREEQDREFREWLARQPPR